MVIDRKRVCVCLSLSPPFFFATESARARENTSQLERERGQKQELENLKECQALFQKREGGRERERETERTRKRERENKREKERERERKKESKIDRERHTGCRRPIGCLKLRVISHKRANKYRFLLRKMIY